MLCLSHSLNTRGSFLPLRNYTQHSLSCSGSCLGSLQHSARLTPCGRPPMNQRFPSTARSHSAAQVTHSGTQVTECCPGNTVLPRSHALLLRSHRVLPRSHTVLPRSHTVLAGHTQCCRVTHSAARLHTVLLSHTQCCQGQAECCQGHTQCCQVTHSAAQVTQSAATSHTVLPRS